MGLSPLTVAVFAAVATLNLSTLARGQTLEPVETNAAQQADSQPSFAPSSLKPLAPMNTASPAPAAGLAQTPDQPEPAPESPTEPPADAAPQPAIPGPQEEPAPVDSPAAPTSPQPPAGSPNEPTLQFPPDEAPQPTAPAPGVQTPTPDNQTAPTPPPAPDQEEAEPALPVQPGPPVPGLPIPPDQPAQPAAPEPQVLVSEVLVEGVEGALQEEVYQAIQTRPGRTTTRSQLQEDINAVFATGFFANVRAEPSDTPLGVRITFAVEPNPVLNAVRLEGNQVVTQEAVDQIFRSQYGQTLNLRRFQAGVRQLNQLYQDRGFVLGQVVSAPRVNPDGTVVLAVAEGVIEDVQVRFLTEENQPTEGRTRQFIITREFANLEPGNVLNRNEVQQDLQRAFGLGLFEDVQLALEPGKDPRQVVAIVNVKERKTGSIGAGAGFSSNSGIFGSVNYQQQNLGGNNQKLGAAVQVGPRQLDFDVSFTDPWIAGDRFRTSYTVNAFNRFTRPFIFDGGDPEVNLPPEPGEEEGDSPRVFRLGGGVSFTRPLGRGWSASLGTQYQRVSLRDNDRDPSPVDEEGNPLSFSAFRGQEEGLPNNELSATDDLFLLSASAVQDRRDNPLTPTRGSVLRVGMEQSVPIGSGNILLNRLRSSYSFYVPVRFTRFTEGAQALAFNLQAGTILGDLPPYEAFSLGGTNTVRGYGEGEVGAGRSYVLASAEYRFPVFSAIGGALFADFASDLGTASSVPGDPAGVRGKPGTGFGYGIGVRVRSPLGPIRVDYGRNDEGESRIHFGIGERF